MTLKVSWSQALAWRLERQLLNPVGDLSVADTVRRLCGVQSQVASSAELAVRRATTSSRTGEVARALANGSLIKTWAMRGTLHLLTPEDAGIYLSLLAAGRSWEAPELAEVLRRRDPGRSRPCGSPPATRSTAGRSRARSWRPR